MNQVDCKFSKLKEIQLLKKMNICYVENSNYYFIFVVDAPALLTFLVTLSKTGNQDIADISDFEGNYKSTSVIFSSMFEGISSELGNYVYPKSSTSKESQLVTQLVHRKNLTWQPEGFYFKTNNTAIYDKKLQSMKITQAAATGQNYIYVDTIRWASVLFSYTVKEGGTSETKTIASIDLANKKITFTSALANSYTTSAICEIEQIKISLSGQKTMLDYYVLDNHSDAAYRGVDVQALRFRGYFKDLDRVSRIFVWHPAYGANVSLGEFGFKGITFCGDGTILRENAAYKSETTSTINTGLVVRIEFEAGDILERLICLDVEWWRQ